MAADRRRSKTDFDQQLRWLLEGLNPSSQRRFRNGSRISLKILKILRNAGKSDDSVV